MYYQSGTFLVLSSKCTIVPLCLQEHCSKIVYIVRPSMNPRLCCFLVVTIIHHQLCITVGHSRLHAYIVFLKANTKRSELVADMANILLGILLSSLSYHTDEWFICIDHPKHVLQT